MRVLVGVVDQEQLRARRRGRVWGDQRQGVWILVHPNGARGFIRDGDPDSAKTIFQMRP